MFIVIIPPPRILSIYFLQFCSPVSPPYILHFPIIFHSFESAGQQKSAPLRGRLWPAGCQGRTCPSPSTIYL